MKKKQNSNVKNVIILVVLVALVIGFFVYSSNRAVSTATGDDLKLTAVQEVITRDLDTDYPPTPKELVKYYSDIMKCLYSDDGYTDEEFEAMADKMLALYDDELLEINPRDFYITSLKSDVDSFKEDNKAIISYTTSASTDVETATIDGRECAKLYCTYKIRVGTDYIKSKEVYELRKDSDGHWKILGFKLADEDNTTTTE